MNDPSALYSMEGQCGDNVNRVMTSAGTLTISGTGPMWNYDFESNKSPFNGNASVRSVVIGNGVTALGSRAFADCTSLAKIRIPASITAISADVFDGVNKSRLIIFGTPGSAAQTFAESQGIAFEAE